MDYNLFENLYKYKETENKSQLENFLTELFVYVLKSLIFQKNEVIITLLNDKFHIPFTKNDFDNIEIDTQIRYDTSDDYHPQPDISIINNNSDLYLIESKVDSSLNQYDDIDQIQLYESVITDYKLKGVRTLTKYEIYTKDRDEYKLFNAEKHKVFWYQIYELL
ncbi:MAG: hypothetical protein J6Y01_05335, partial [Spirochaetales bacterium]|nr:hypothetical protein [Spirochaetales bacterium]